MSNKKGVVDTRKQKKKDRQLKIKFKAELKELESQSKFLHDYFLCNKIYIDDLIKKRDWLVQNYGKEKGLEVQNWIHSEFQKDIKRYKHLMSRVGNKSDIRKQKTLDDFDRLKAENNRLVEKLKKGNPKTEEGQYMYWKQMCKSYGSAADLANAYQDECNRLESLNYLILDFEKLVRRTGPFTKVKEAEGVEQTVVDKLMKAYEILHKVKKAVPDVGMEEEELQRALAASMGNKDAVVKSDKEEVVKADNSDIKEKQSKPSYPPLPEEPKVADKNLLCMVGVRLPDGRML